MADPWAGATRVSLEKLTDFVAETLRALGVTEPGATEAATILLQADLRGVDSHGIARLPSYAGRFRAGLINQTAELTTLAESPATLALDANNGFALCLAPEAMRRCIDKAETSGLCLTTVRNSNHFGIAGAYAMMAAARDLGGIAMTNASPLVIPTFGAQGMLGTNPIAFAVPTGGGPPLVLDMSTSAVAWGKIEIARRAGLPIPFGWATDEAGEPTSDPHTARWLLPLGGDRATSGHKGYGLALMVDLFCGILAGSAWSARISGSHGPGQPAGIGHTFMAWRIDAFRDPTAFFADLQTMLADLRATPPASGHEVTGVLIPGDPESETEAINRRLGIPIKPAVLAELQALREDVGLSWDLNQVGH
ncbi:MAG: Ldh family oxidoreductase [Chloroflexota bacterium]|nr:Ldh family oxidoreductase [Chloroflexota bacterium]